MFEASTNVLPMASDSSTVKDVVVPVDTPHIVAHNRNMFETSTNVLPMASYSRTVIDLVVPVDTPHIVARA